MFQRIRLTPNIDFAITETKTPKPRLAVGNKVEWHRKKPYTACTRCHSRLSLVSVDDEKSCLMCGHVVYPNITSVLDNRYGSAYR